MLANIVDLLQAILHRYTLVHFKKKPDEPVPVWRPTIPRDAPEARDDQGEIVALLESLAPLDTAEV